MADRWTKKIFDQLLSDRLWELPAWWRLRFSHQEYNLFFFVKTCHCVPKLVGFHYTLQPSIKMEKLFQVIDIDKLQMILLWKDIGNNFTIKMHWKWFYYKNALLMVLWQKGIGNDFSTKIHWKLFYNKIHWK